MSISIDHHASPAHLLSEVVATAGLLLVIFSLARTGRSSSAPAAVGAYIGAAYWFTSVTVHLIAIGGSDAGISAALRARELDPACDVTVVVGDSFQNFSICGIPYHVSVRCPTGARWRTKRVDIAATAIYSDLTVDQVSELDLSYTPPLGSPGPRCKPERKPGARR